MNHMMIEEYIGLLSHQPDFKTQKNNSIKNKPRIINSLNQLAILIVAELFLPSLLCAQTITPEQNSTGTEVNQTGNTYKITGGVQSEANLFHSFQEFGLNSGENAKSLIPQLTIF